MLLGLCKHTWLLYMLLFKNYKCKIIKPNGLQVAVHVTSALQIKCMYYAMQCRVIYNGLIQDYCFTVHVLFITLQQIDVIAEYKKKLENDKPILNLVVIGEFYCINFMQVDIDVSVKTSIDILPSKSQALCEYCTHNGTFK